MAVTGGLALQPFTAPPVAAASGVRLGPLETMCLDVAGAEPGDLVVVNATVTEPSAAGHLTIHNEQSNPSRTSTVNFQPAQTVPAMAMIEVTDARQVCATNSVHSSVDAVIDLLGTIPAAAVARVNDQPDRVLDTRLNGSPTASKPVMAGGTVCAATGGTAGEVVVANVTVDAPSAAGHLTTHAKGLTNPGGTSSLNYVANMARANLTIVELGTDGELCATVSNHASTHVIFDVIAFLKPSAFDSIDAARRVLDTRQESSPTGGQRVVAGTPACTDSLGSAGQAVIANVTIPNPSGDGHANTHAESARSDRSSTHNFVAGTDWPNLTITTLGSGGKLCVTPYVSDAHVVVDVIGLLAAATASGLKGVGERLVDTRTSNEIPGRVGESRLQFGQTCDALLDRFKTTHLEILDGYGEVAYDDTPLPSTNGNSSVTAPFSITNVQVEGIDEGDLVETDGTYLYSESNGALQVLNIAAGSVVSSVVLPGEHAELILADDRLMVTTQGYDVVGTQTNVTVFDVSDPTSPAVVEQYGLDGTRVAMRGVGQTVHLVLQSYRRPYDVGAYSETEDPIEAAKADVENSTIADWLPRQFEIGDGAYTDESPAIGCGDIGLPTTGAGGDLVWVSSLDISGSADRSNASGILASAGEASVMATADRLYVSTTLWGDWNGWWGSGSATTGIHLFDLAGGRPAYRASTDLPGRVLNQFSMGEHDGVLRVAATAGWWDNSESYVFALKPTGSTFERISAVGGLGSGEQIYAVRHLGPMSYVVTFRQTDPLYVVDFTDPSMPRQRGELKIPGFSTYLHPVDGVRLIGVGSDADPNTGVVTGSQLSLFSVADPDNPARLDVEDIDVETYLPDHRAFLYWPADGTIATPAFDPDTGNGQIAVSRLVGDQIRYRGTFAASACMPYRTVVVGNRLIAVANGQVTIVDRSDLSPIATIGTC